MNYPAETFPLSSAPSLDVTACIAVLRVAENDALATFVTGHVRQIEGIVDSETLVGFHMHSHHDLNRLF